ncbi:hypothetical protein YN1_7600 [Nanoarchaeota archaeon]
MNEDLKELLESANEDLEAAKILLDKNLFKSSAFYCQQCVEKYLKAYLLYKTGSYPFIHSIKNLIELCINVDKEFNYLYDINADKLDKYYTGTRYFPFLKITEEDAKEAIDIAENVREFILKKLS